VGCRPFLVLGEQTLDELYGDEDAPGKDFAVARNLSTAIDYVLQEEALARAQGPFLRPAAAAPILDERPFLERPPIRVRDVGRWLAVLVVGSVWLSLGIAYLLVSIYRVQPLPEVFYYLTLQFVPRFYRGLLFLGTGVVLTLLAYRRMAAAMPRETPNRWAKPLVARDIRQWLPFFLISSIWMSVGITYILVNLYRNHAFPGVTYYITLQFIDRLYRGLLSLAAGAAVILFALRRLGQELPGVTVQPRRIWAWLLLLIVGGVWLNLGVAYLLVVIYREQPLPEVFYYLTLQFIPRFYRGLLFLSTGLIVAVLGFRHVVATLTVRPISARHTSR
jgi:hypothetical protein